MAESTPAGKNDEANRERRPRGVVRERLVAAGLELPLDPHQVVFDNGLFRPGGNAGVAGNGAIAGRGTLSPGSGLNFGPGSMATGATGARAGSGVTASLDSVSLGSGSPV